MFAKIVRKPNADARIAAAVISGLMLLITADNALAGGGKTNNGGTSSTATWTGTNIVRDHRRQPAGTPQQPLPQCQLYNGHWVGYGCTGRIVRDHRH